MNPSPVLDGMSVRFGSMMIGTKIRNTRIAMTEPNTENAWTMNAWIHCWRRLPSSSGERPKIGGAIR